MAVSSPAHRALLRAPRAAGKRPRGGAATQPLAPAVERCSGQCPPRNMVPRVQKCSDLKQALPSEWASLCNCVGQAPTKPVPESTCVRVRACARPCACVRVRARACACVGSAHRAAAVGQRLRPGFGVQLTHEPGPTQPPERPVPSRPGTEPRSPKVTAEKSSTRGREPGEFLPERFCLDNMWILGECL